MNNEQNSVFFKAMMTGLFIGIVDTIICLGYNIGYRDLTGYLPSAFINVSSLIFAINILLVVVGIVYFGFVRLFGKRDIVFVIAMLMVTAFCLWKLQTGHRFDNERLDGQFHGLLGGIILVLGFSSASIPFWYHNRKFEEHVLGTDRSHFV
jgi:hypothetical protein